ncbi:M6 family metalloprotease domain-containing protein [Streptomyces sp. NPDC058467]|uniref:M6 family metalloprotease domain-containing protein n=1 Tax=Streptomyces sp. NPDC058467 TaxID=3346513 RepID=UPI00365152D0
MGRGGPFRGPVREGAPRWRSTAALFTSMTALAATSLVPGPALAEPRSASCALPRTEAHHSEGVDTWNSGYVRPNHPLDAAMVFLSFPDSAPRTTPAELTSDYFPATSRFFERASYGKFTVRPHPQRGWIRMPHTSTSYAIERDWNADRRAAYLRDALAAADSQVDFSRYDIVYFVADPDAPGVDSDATKVVNLDTPLYADGKEIRRVVTVFEKHPPDRLVLAHETGHVFDLPDLYHRPTDGKGDWDTYVGDWDLMGSQFGLAPDLFGWHKWKLGWLEPHQVACVRGTGSTRVTLEALGAGPPTLGGGTAGAAGAAGVAGVAGVAGAAEAGSAGAAASASGTRTRSHGAHGSGVPGASGNSGVPAYGSAASRASGASGASGVPAYGSGVQAYGSGLQAFGSGRGTKLAVVRTGPDSALALEARGPAGNDGATCTQGVLVYRVRSEAESGGGPIEVLDAHPHSESCWEDSVYPALADAPVALGESYTVPGENVRIEVEDRTASGAWTVKITTG